MRATRIPAAAFLAAIAGACLAQPGIEKVSFQVASPFDRRAAVVGELRIPESTRERLPAVMILTSLNGFDGRGAFYAEAFNQAGVATFEADLVQGRGAPASPGHSMPNVYQALRFLADHPRIDGARVGIMGFSWGGLIALVTSSEDWAREYGGKLRLAAHLGLYPICWRHHAVMAGKSTYFPPAVYQRVTGKPVHILSGEKDGYDGADGCQEFLAALPVTTRPYFSMTAYADATFAWDSRFSSAVWEAGANKGKGGIVQQTANAEIAGRSREFAVAYFRKHLAAD